MPPIKVLHMIDGLQVGGAEVLLRDMLPRLPRERFGASVCYGTPGPIAAELQAAGVPMRRIARRGWADPRWTWGLWQAARRARPDVVHTHLVKSDLFGRLAARLAGVPLVVTTLHNTDAWAARPLLGRLYGLSGRLADRHIAVSDEVGRYHVRHSRLPADSVITIENGVDVDRFRGQAAAGQAVRADFGLAPDAPVAGIVAGLRPQKDHAAFLRAAADIQRELPQARFLVVGAGALRPELEALAGQLGLGAAVVFTGLRTDIPAVMAALDVLVIASRWEGLPVTALEAMAAARPVVATAVGALPRVIQPGQTGLLVPPADPAALAQACLRVLTDGAWARQLGEAGRARAEANYSLDSMVRRTAHLYEALVAQRSQAAGWLRPA